MMNTVLLSVVFVLLMFTAVRTQLPVEQTGLFTVTRSDDRNEICLPGDCSLREAINAANGLMSDDTIDFASGLTNITLVDQEIVIGPSGALTLKGPGADRLTINGGAGTNRILYSNGSALTILGMTLTGGGGTGASYSGQGGAVFSNGGSLTIDGVLLTGNEATGSGGGIYLRHPYSDAFIANSTISNNLAGWGGGGLSGGSYRRVVLVNTTISGNKGTYYGGAFDIAANLILRNVTITNNIAREGGGIYAHKFTYFDMGNTILAGNHITGSLFLGPEIYIECDTSCAGFTSVGGNLVGDSPGDSTNTQSIAIAYLPSDIRDKDPLLGPLNNNGGPTPTHAMSPEGLAIDRGLNAAAIDPRSGKPLAFDQRGTGFKRIQSPSGNVRATVDIGAFEYMTSIVTNVEELYSAINDPNNAGTRIILAPGLYVLSAIDPTGLERPNRGRLELQQHMSLSGVPGDRTAVLIDASFLPSSTFEMPITGIIRVGLGSNSVEWLTINGHPSATASIETDLHWAGGPARVSVAHIVSMNSHRGVDVRNITAPGREIHVEINDTDLSGGVEGIRISNQNDSPGARIFVRMKGNYAHDNNIGCIIANARVSTGFIRVQSIGDTFTENGTGVLLNGGLVVGGNTANSNFISFEADGSRFINNNGTPFGPQGGLMAMAGQSGLLNATSNNTLDVHLRNCQIYGNAVVNFAAFGARSGANPPVLAGTNNRTTVYFYGPGSRNHSLVATNSVPAEPEGTNTVTIVKDTVPFPGDFASWSSL